jgi:hypothetical protein
MAKCLSFGRSIFRQFRGRRSNLETWQQGILIKVYARTFEAEPALTSSDFKRLPENFGGDEPAILNRLPKGKGSRMTAPKITAPLGLTRTARLFLLDPSGGRIHTMRIDGADCRIIVTNCHLPKSIVVNVDAARIYWTNMGVPRLGDGSIESADIDGRNRRTIVPQGVTRTPHQIQIDKSNGKLYWSDREGMRVMRANLDGSHVETLVQTGRSYEDRRDQSRWCIGIAIDPKLGKVYWTQKSPDNAGLGRICRANMTLLEGENPAHRSDIEVVFDQLPEPIDLDLDQPNRMLYWTDRGQSPRGSTVSRAPVDRNGLPEILVTHLMEGIGIALDVSDNRMFITDFGGSVYSTDLNGKNVREIIHAKVNIGGVAYADE